jgi:hypothetical protein
MPELPNYWPGLGRMPKRGNRFLVNPPVPSSIWLRRRLLWYVNDARPSSRNWMSCLLRSTSWIARSGIKGSGMPLGVGARLTCSPPGRNVSLWSKVSLGLGTNLFGNCRTHERSF